MSSDTAAGEQAFSSLDELRKEVFPESARRAELHGDTEEESRKYGRLVAEELLEKYRERLGLKEPG